MSLRRSFSVSVLIHAFFLIAWVLLLQYQPAQQNLSRTITIEVEPLRNRDTVHDRIVQTRKVQPSDHAAPDSYLGEQTQVVDRQTVNRNKTLAIGSTQAPPKADARKDARAKPLAKLGLPILPEARKKDFSRPEESTDSGVPQDYIQGLKESETTALNTREYVFYGYFQRIRERLDLAWANSLREQLFKLYRSGRQLASDMDHTTRLVVFLNSSGEITRVQVLEESGTHDLDEAAVRAFNDAGPFPNPPKGMVDRNGQIQIHWDFVLRS